MSDTKLPNPESRVEEYLANILSVMDGVEPSYDPGLPQSREEQYLTQIVSAIKEKGSGGGGGSDIETIEAIVVSDDVLKLSKAPTGKEYILKYQATPLNIIYIKMRQVKYEDIDIYQGSTIFELNNQAVILSVMSSGVEAEGTELVLATNKDLETSLAGYQELLESGTNIKTINGNSILGSGDLTIKASNEATALFNEDLNDLKTDGTSYYASGSNTVTNKPTGIDAFGLVVRRTASGYYAQYLTGANQSTNSIYVRTYKSETWTEWTKLLDNQSESTLLDKFAEYARLASDNTFSGNNVFKNGTVSVEDTTSTADTTTYHGNHIHRIRRNKVDGTSSSWDFQLPSVNGTLATKEDIESVYAKKTDLNAYATTAILTQKIPDPPSANGTYIYKAIRSDSGVTFEWVLES